MSKPLPSPIAQLTLVVCAISSIHAEAVSSPLAQAGGVIVTIQPTDFSVADNGAVRSVKQVPQLSVFRLSSARIVETVNQAKYFHVAPTQHDLPTCDGLILRQHAFDLSAMRKRVISQLPSEVSPAELAEDMPAIIRVSHPEIIRAWRDIATAVDWYDQQPLEDRSPDPYFARGQLWTAVGSHSDALMDFLEAASLVRQRDKGNLLEYSRYFTVLESALSREIKLPGTAHLETAKTYWGFGISQMRVGRYDEAVLDFSDAVRLRPSEPLYWYSRSLAFKSIGADDRAERDARIGVAAEDRVKQAGDFTHYIDRHLSSLQGPTRLWLYKLRHGDRKSWRR